MDQALNSRPGTPPSGVWPPPSTITASGMNWPSLLVSVSIKFPASPQATTLKDPEFLLVVYDTRKQSGLITLIAEVLDLCLQECECDCRLPKSFEKGNAGIASERKDTFSDNGRLCGVTTCQFGRSAIAVRFPHLYLSFLS